ncbi:hypothetical protein IV102_35855 [bacterium]|nr:hypothetical protein [bacterium]
MRRLLIICVLTVSGWSEPLRLSTARTADVAVLVPQVESRYRALGGHGQVELRDGAISVTFRDDDEQERLLFPLLAPGNWQLWIYYFDPRAGEFTVQDIVPSLGYLMNNQYPRSHYPQPGHFVRAAEVREQKLVIELDILAGNSKIDISHGGDTLFAFGLDERQCALASLELKVDADRYLTHETIPEGYQRGQILVKGMTSERLQELAAIIRSGPYTKPLWMWPQN